MPLVVLLNRQSIFGIRLTMNVWMVVGNALQGERSAFVPTPEGDVTEIVKVEVSTPKNILGIWDCPAGVAEDHLTFIYDKVKSWIQHMKHGHLPTHIWAG